ncbi:penicillin acylase family protein [Roseateles terrae]|uniref:Penicillin amidase n=1 Tax=Roseateles terrae TaxID=431060 RepID=A0ABR6GSD0_9BURK|nr:penicillin acylase family protein [Roseateles terrae]MBB3195035.1 penicillin amidase [Roseateles terrae]
MNQSSKRPWGRWVQRTVVALMAVLLLAVLAVWLLIRASLPKLDGDVQLPGVTQALDISRDALGTVVLTGQNRLDVARGLGWVHAQERFFEMDLTRRSAAGELSALFGPKALDRDRQRRVHRLRARLTERFQSLPAQEKALLQAYADGVNAGLQALPVRSWQYLLLRAEPQAWTPVDSLLVISEMYFMLQSGSIEAGLERVLVREQAGDRVYDWLYPRGGVWDAALDGSAVGAAAMPGAGELDLRVGKKKSREMDLATGGQVVLAPPEGCGEAALRAETAAFVRGAGPSTATAASMSELSVIGSNNWAVSGARSVHGGAILADDMHLGLGVPSIWFRAQFQIGSGAQALRAAGVTLPGLPAIVVGSNGHVAWGFTNAYGQWFDWVEVPRDAKLVKHEEVLAVHGGASQTFVVEELDGAPVVATEDQRRFALHWVAHEGEAYSLVLDEMLNARHVSDALSVAQRAGMPHQNLIAADRGGQIGWTIAGRLWSQRGIAQTQGRLATVAEMHHTWLRPDQYPQVLSPAQGQLWTANNRQLGGELADVLGDGGFDLGARAQQIRDRLGERAKHDEASVGAIHLDDEARFMKSWVQRFQALLNAHPDRTQLAQVLAGWNGRADADQIAYRLVRTARLNTLNALWTAWTRPFLGERQDDEKRRIRWRNQFEYSAVQALNEQPPHLLPIDYASWDALLLAQLDAAAKEMSAEGPLAQATWGHQNSSRIQHVMAKAIPALSRWLDMPSAPQSGDTNMPHVAGPAFGQSERLVVSPGREENGWLSMPGGQSGHPLSPFYGAGHEDWVNARPTPLLAGSVQHRITAVAP